MTDLSKMITKERFERMQSVLDKRTRYMSVILENLYDPHNISAILRTAEAYGVQDVHVIEKTNKFQVSSGVSMGSDQWLSLSRYKDTKSCFQSLKDQGYALYYADPAETNPSIFDISLEKPFCVIMGQEKEGVSKEAIDLADGGFRIPLYGFVESFNVSVAWAIIANTFINRLRASLKDNYFLSAEEKKELLERWLLKNNFKKNIQSFL